MSAFAIFYVGAAVVTLGYVVLARRLLNPPEPSVPETPLECGDAPDDQRWQDEATEQLTTMVYGILCVSTGEFHYVSAGHPGPIQLPFNAEPVILESAGFPLGLTDEPYSERAVCLRPGDRLYLYSDGIPEAMNAAGEQFGNLRLLHGIAQRRGEPLQQSASSLLAEVLSWQGSEKTQDDISIVAVEMPVELTAKH